MPEPVRLILASASVARKAMLEGAGLKFDVIPADLDETAVRNSAAEENPQTEPADIAALLAVEKARQVSRLQPNALVIGSDQVLALGDRIFAKAGSMNEAREILCALRGCTHTLVSAVALARDGEVYWRTSDSAQLTMRNFSDVFLEAYLKRIGDQALRGVGCYELEGLGAQLFDRVEGDWFTILGLPLLPLLERLRQEAVIAA
jgi:septum formation protein